MNELTASDVKVMINDAQKVLEDKIVFRDTCHSKHKEVIELKDNMQKLDDCVSTKFSALTKWIFALLGALALNLFIMILNLLRNAPK